MVNSHSKSFFGQNTGLIVISRSKFEPFIFFNFIKMKANGNWEKLSNNEGKIVKIALEEMVSILMVLNRQNLSWQNSHNYKEKRTTFSFSWQDDALKILWINIDNYSKMLNTGQIAILRLLMTHILHEKIIYSTSIDFKADNTKNHKHLKQDAWNYRKIDEKFMNDYEYINENILSTNLYDDFSLNDVTTIESIIINETEKALMLKLGEENIWIPKSTIHNHYEPIKGKVQEFLISNWILKRY